MKNRGCNCSGRGNRFREKQQNKQVVPNKIIVGSNTREQRSRMLDSVRAKSNMTSLFDEKPKLKNRELKALTPEAKQGYKASVQVEEPAIIRKLAEGQAQMVKTGGSGGMIVAVLALSTLIWAVSKKQK